MTVDIEARSFGEMAVVAALQLADVDLLAVNTKENPNRVRPTKLDEVRLEGGRYASTVQPASWNLINLALA